MNPGGPKSGSGTAHSVSDVIKEGTDELLESLENSEFGNRRRGLTSIGVFYGHAGANVRLTIPTQVFKRDGDACLLTGLPFKPVEELGVHPVLAYLIPTSTHSKVCLE
jgi:hypothetical protein